MRNNPIKNTDPTGHWTEEELEQALGEDWRTIYFGEGGVFFGRDELLEFLLSENTTDLLSLDIISDIFNISNMGHSAGLDFSSIDAIGSRASVSGGLVGFLGVSLDVVLNLSSGQFSVFGSPEGGLAIGETATIVGGITLYGDLSSNNDFRGVAKTIGAMGGNIAGIAVERNWSSSMEGGFIGVGAAVPGIAFYGSLSFSFEALRVDKAGYHWFPYVPGPIDVLGAIGDVLWNDIFHLP